MTTWRVLTWNLQGSQRPNLDVLAEVIAAYAPDVVALQEVQRHQASGLARRLGWPVLWTRKHYPYTPLLRRRAEGLAMMTFHSMTDTVTASISPGVSTWIYLHRVAMAATVHGKGQAIRVANTHLASHSAEERIAQARRVAALVGAFRPVVVAGDFNAPDELEVTREFRVLGVVDPGGAYTNPSIAPRQRLDFVLVPETATVTARLTPEGGEQWMELSDHLPVLVEFSI
ncbi:MAG: hypothetical protein QOE09_2225 [Ilumatobacteraceae bacterium]